MLLADVNDLEWKDIVGCRLLSCPHHSEGTLSKVTSLSTLKKRGHQSRPRIDFSTQHHAVGMMGRPRQSLPAHLLSVGYLNASGDQQGMSPGRDWVCEDFPGEQCAELRDVVPLLSLLIVSFHIGIIPLLSPMQSLDCLSGLWLVP